MTTFRQLRLLALAAAASAFCLTAPARADQESQARTPASKIDLSKFGKVESLYKGRSAIRPESKNLSILGSLSPRYHYDSRMLRAADIASSRAYAHSQGSCWRYVKNALLSANLVDSRPKTAYAKEAAAELTGSYGFRRVPCTDPMKAPLGSVLVYGGTGAGHVEIRTKYGFVSDFYTTSPSKRPLIGVFVKP